MKNKGNVSVGDFYLKILTERCKFDKMKEKREKTQRGNLRLFFRYKIWNNYCGKWMNLCGDLACWFF